MLTITTLESAGVQVLPFDIVWTGERGDFEVSCAAGLTAKDPIATAVVMLLFTDARGTDSEMRRADETDKRGWVGDGFDVDTADGEAALGSRLWLYRREALTDEVARKFDDECRRALEPLIKQGAASRIDVSAVPMAGDNLMRLTIDIYGRDGGKRFSDRFEILWSNGRAV